MKSILLFLLIFAANFVFAQRTVTGIITDKSGQPVSDVRVAVKNSNNQTFTNVDGKYSIEVPEGYRTLEFSKREFRVQEVEIVDNVVNITLTSIYDVKDIFELSLEELMQVEVIVASKVSQKQEEAPSIVSVVTSREIEMYGARDITDVLRMIPGFEFGMDVNSLFGLFFRGAWGFEGKILIMINGLCVNELAYGNYNFFGTIPASMISKVEIIRGPGSSIYGGFAGVTTINIITKSGEELNGGQINSHLTTFQKDFGFGGNISYGLKTEKVNISANVGYSQTPLSNRDYVDFAGNSFTMGNESSKRRWWHVITKAKINDFSFGYNRNSLNFYAQDWFGNVVPQINGNGTALLNNFTETASFSYQKKMGEI